MKILYIILILFIFMGGYVLGIFPIWALLLPTIAIPIFTINEYGLGITGIKSIVSIIIGVVFLIVMFPLITSLSGFTTLGVQQTTTTTVTSNSTTTEETILMPFPSSTTSWSGITGVTTMFTVLLPIIFIVGAAYTIFGNFMGHHAEDYYDDTGRVHIGRTYRQYGYDWAVEQGKFHKDILDMDKIFRSET